MPSPRPTLLIFIVDDTCAMSTGSKSTAANRGASVIIVIRLERLLDFDMGREKIEANMATIFDSN